MYIFIYLYIKIGIIFKEERLNYCVKKIRKFESSGVQYRKYTTIKNGITWHFVDRPLDKH
jgi:hypothetical protein